jgi:ABC-type branched-subunit amino acid transport system ATPase component
VSGEVRVILGRNGVGKSTLLKIAAGLIAADSGLVQLDGRTVGRPTLARLAHKGVCWLNRSSQQLRPAFPLVS